MQTKTRRLQATIAIAIVAAVTVLTTSLLAVRTLGRSDVAQQDPVAESAVAFEPSVDSAYRSAWITYWDDGPGLQSLKANAKRLNELHPFWFEAQSATKIVTQGNAAFRNSVLQTARENDIKIVPTLTESLKTDDFIAIVGNPAARAQHVEAVCALVKNNNFDGIDIDYELFAINAKVENVEPAKQAFSAFISELAPCLHDAGKRLEVTLLPKTDDSAFAPYLTSLAPGVFDYRAIGAAADIVRPMAYDQATPLTQPGSTDPVSWVEAVGQYARKHVPARKIVLGLALYGYDWNARGAKAITAHQAPITARKNDSVVQYDEVTKSHYFEYTASDETLHHVWFDTTADTIERVKLAQELRLEGVSYWALGSEDTGFWK